jgi:hypothetical protein
MDPSGSEIRSYEDAVVDRLRVALASPAPPGWEWRFARNFVVEREGTYPDSALLVRWEDPGDGSRNGWRYPFWYEGPKLLPTDRTSNDPDREVQEIHFTIFEGIEGNTFRYIVAVDAHGTTWLDDEP